MANYATLKAAIADVVKTNGSQAITGANLQQVLISVVNSIGSGYLFMGVATPSTDPGTPDQNVFYVGAAGTYGNFGTSYTVNDGSIGVFRYNGSWSRSQLKMFDGIDTYPNLASANLITSDGVANSIVRQPFIGEFASTDDMYPYNIKYDLQGAMSANAYRKTTDFYEVHEGMEVLCRFEGSSSSTLQLIAFDEGKNVVLSASLAEAGTTPVYRLYIVPQGVRYLRFTSLVDVTAQRVRFIVANYTDASNNKQDIWECFDCSYGDDIESIYIPIGLDGVVRANFASLTHDSSYTNRVILVLRDASDTMIARSQLYNVSANNGEIFEMKITDASDSSLVGSTLAYVVFKDFSHFISQKDASTSVARYNMINYKAALNPLNFTKLSELNTLSYYDITYPGKITSNYLDQDQYIDEVYIAKKVADGNKIIVRFTQGRLIVQDCYNIGNSYYRNFAAMKYLTDYSDGQVIPMTVTSTNDAETYPLGMLIGYVIVKDKAHASLVNDTTNNGNYVLSKDFVYQLLNSPKIAAYLSNIDNPIAPLPDNSVSIVIPNVINAVVGDTLQLFFKSVVKCPNYKDYGIVAACSIGKSYPRYYEVTPVAGDIGSKSLTIMVYGEGMKVVAQKQATLNVIAQATSPSTNKNILLVAASTFASGIIMPEVKRRLTGTGGTPSGLGLSNISFIGRKEVDGVHQEATGGYSWQTYATDAFKSHRFYVSGVSAVTLDATYTIEGVPIPSGVGYLVVKEVNITEGTGNILCEVYGGAVYPQGSIPASGTLVKSSGTGDDTILYSSQVTEDGNPFWYNGDIDFSYYSATYCGGADIDVLIAHLGLNGFSSTANVDLAIENYAKPFIRKFHEDYPSGIFLLETLQLGSPDGGYASVGYANATQNWYNISKTYWYAVEKYQELAQDAEFSSYVIVGNITPEYDCEYGYPTTEKKVNIRSSEDETIQTNQIHPTNDGKLLLADSIYRDLTNIL